MHNSDFAPISRRQALAGAALAAVAVGANTLSANAQSKQSESTQAAGNNSMKLCLNTSTVRGQKLKVPEQIKLAAGAGYEAIELWMGDLAEFVKSGGQLSDLRKQLEDSGLIVPSAIGFAKWIVDDAGERAKGLETAKHDMAVLAEIGGLRIAAPPVGATNEPGLSLDAAAERYAKLLDLGREMGVVPQLELWGFSKNLYRLGEVAYVATQCGHEDACILPDVYHIFKGGSDFAGLGMLNPQRIHVFHINDYPDAPPREEMKDADRVYPGDGVAPLKSIFGNLYAAGFRGVLSLELFNPNYYQQDAMLVAKTGLEKMKAVVAEIV